MEIDADRRSRAGLLLSPDLLVAAVLHDDHRDRELIIDQRGRRWWSGRPVSAGTASLW
jgi:hypothetical protein